MLNIGDVVLDYRIVDLIGRGDSSIVYKAEVQKNGRVVALKVFPCSPTDAADVVTRLRKEAAAVQWLKDSGICQVEAIEQTDDLICVAMELLQGTPLDVLIDGKAISPLTAVEYACEIASAFDAAHSRAILHLDLKPSKIIVSTTGLKILDFGIARIMKQLLLQ